MDSPDTKSSAQTRLTFLGRPSERKSPEEFLRSFDPSEAPASPGCYLMHDERDKVIYVGKAKNLRARVRTYLNDQDSRYSVKFLMRRVTHIDFLVTATEKEALLLENSLIKQLRPRYNVQLRDDKTYVSLRLNKTEEFPRITVVRRHKKDGASYYGPYSSAQAVRETLRNIHRVFPLRTCTDHVMSNRSRPCIYYQMKRCVAPCVGYVNRDEYHEIAEQAAMVLAGRSTELENVLREKIQARAEKLEYEQAAILRDRLYALHRTMEKQRTVDVPGAEDRDVFAMHCEGRIAEVQIVFFRGGRMTGGRSFTHKQLEMPLDELMSSFILQYYADAPSIPSEVLLPLPLEDAETIGEILTEQRGSRVAVHHPQRGEKKALVELAAKNARLSFEEKRLAEQARKDVLDEVREKLNLPITPNRIECFDMSIFQGDKGVGSMVVFEGGEPNKARYRKYSMKQVEGQDDFAMMREVLMRRYKRAIEENDLPDLVLIDGGKGQLGVAVAAFKDLGIEDLPVISIAKARAQEAGNKSLERFFTPGRSNPIILPQNSQTVLYLARIRDEAHRFAITYHRKRRSKSTLTSVLTEVPGVGPKRARSLLNAFGSVAKIRESPVDRIAEVAGFTEDLARAVKGYLAMTPENS